MTHERTYRTFLDIIEGVLESARQVYDSDEDGLVDKVKRWINFRYLQVQAYRKWKWRKTERPLFIRARYSGTSVSTTNLSRSIVVTDDLSQEAANDWVGRKFYVAGQKEIYTIVAVQQWTSPTASVTFLLNGLFVGATATAQAFTVFQDEYGMWPDFEEFDDVVSFYNQKEVRRVGPAKIMSMFNRSPFMTGKARAVSTVGLKKYEGVKLRDFILGQDFIGNKLSKKARIFPGIAIENYMLPVTFVRKAQLLIEDLDEPLMSQDDRTVLYLGASADINSYLKDQVELENFEARFTAKLEQMANDDQEDADRPQMMVDCDYRSSNSYADSQIYDFGDTEDDIITEI